MDSHGSDIYALDADVRMHVRVLRLLCLIVLLGLACLAWLAWLASVAWLDFVLAPFSFHLTCCLLCLLCWLCLLCLHVSGCVCVFNTFVLAPFFLPFNVLLSLLTLHCSGNYHICMYTLCNTRTYMQAITGRKGRKASKGSKALVL